MEKMKTKQQMLDWIYCLGFCADDMKLYIDTHYDDVDAIEYFNQCALLLKKAKAEYEKLYGELEACNHTSGESWNWNNGKMPWEGEYR